MTDMERTRSASILDRPVLQGAKITWWTVLWVAVFLFIALTRLWDLGSRSYCHDESIHAWEAWKLATGQGYRHDPVYHGPFLYHITALVYLLFGDNDVTGRLATSLAGIALAMAPLFFQKWLGRVGALAASVLVAISPVMMYRSRFIRHDHFALLFNVLLFWAILQYLDRRRARYLYLAAAALSLGFAGKETTFITYFIFGTFLVGLLAWQWLRDRSRNWMSLPVFDLIVLLGTLILPFASPLAIQALGRNPLDYASGGILFSGGVVLVTLAISTSVGLWWGGRKWLICAAIFWGLFIPLFTTLFTNGQGLATGVVGQLGYWLSQHGEARGGQPWYYYIVVMGLYEFLPVLLGTLGAVWYAVSAERSQPSGVPDVADEDVVEEAAPVDTASSDVPAVAGLAIVPFLIYWSFTAFTLYSWAGEKMPWLAMQLVVPLHMLAGWTLGRLLHLDWRDALARGAAWLFLAVPLFIYALARLLTNRPYRDTTIEGLSESMAWLSALIIGLLLLALIVVVARRLRVSVALRTMTTGLVIVLAAVTLRFAWMATFTNAASAVEFLVYAQGSPDDALVANEIETLSRRLTGGLDMKVAYDSEVSWPFVWYLRNYTNGQFFGDSPSGPLDAEVVLVGTKNEAAVKPFLGNRYVRRGYRLIWWPNQNWYSGLTLQKIRDDLRNPVARQKAWDVIWNRKYEASLTAWPYVNNFGMYVRRDVVSELWDYGPETIVVSGSLPGDEYVELWADRPAQAAWGSSGAQLGQFTRPKGIAHDEAGNVYVADSGNHRIQVFDADGQPLRQWGSQGAEPGQLQEPWGVAVAPNGDVYVADTWNHRIQVYDSEGQFLFAWGVFGETSQADASGNLLYGPRDVAFDSQGNLYVTDTGNKRIVKYDTQHQMIGAAGGLGDGEGQLQEPVGIAIGPDDMLYVADTWNHRIQVFDSDLNPVRRWEVAGWESTSVNNKPYLAVDAEGNVYATDPENYRVLVFDGQGKLLRVWGRHGTELAAVNLPTGIEIDPAGRVLVADSQNDRILVYTAE
ncbi:MAG: flippase activity-associated protein Agl23 [Anaerolineae bacterium]